MLLVASSSSSRIEEVENKGSSSVATFRSGLPGDNENGHSDKISEFVVRIGELIDGGQSDEALSEVLDDRNEELLQWAAMDLYGSIGSRMYDGSLRSSDPDAWAHSESILEYMTKFCKAKEVLLALLELAEGMASDPCFHMTLPLLKIAYIRTPKKRGESIVLGLSLIYNYVRSLPIPETQDFDEKEELAILENCPDYVRLELSLLSCLDFTEPFISETKSCSLFPSESERVKQAQQLTSFLLKLVEKPLAYFETSSPTETGKYVTNSFECVDRLTSQLFNISPNVFPKICDWFSRGLLRFRSQYIDETRNTAAAAVDESAVGVVAYFVWCRRFCLAKVPCVYSHSYILELVLPGCVALLGKCGQNALLRKGVNLAEELVDRCLYEDSWDKERLFSKTYQELFFGLVNAMVYCSQEKTRRKSLKVFSTYLEKFTVAGQIAAIRLFYVDWAERKKDLTNGIRGWLVDWYRGKLFAEISSANSAGEPPDEYQKFLPELLDIFCFLKDQETTDLLENFEQYMASLNLLRFICLLALNGQLAVKKQILIRIRERFINVLHRAIELSMGHFKLEIKNERESCQDKEELARSEAMMNVALNSFDLMRSLISRINELLKNDLFGLE